MTDTASLERIDSFPYRHRVQDVMSAPLATARPGSTIAEAARVMSRLGISALVVVDEEGRPKGIVTERDVLEAVAGHRAGAVDLPLGAVMSSPVATVRRDAFVYLAMGRMNRLKIRHLVAVDESGHAVGMVTVRGLLSLRVGSALVIGDEVAYADTVEQMASAKAKLPRLAGELLAEGVDGLGVAAVVSSVLRDLTARAAQLAEQSLADEGWGGPPAPYCVLLLGSGGRRESLFAADQDNAIVHAGSPADDAWYAELGRRLCATLDAAGVSFCSGGVMARESPWRHSLQGWFDHIDGWVRDPQGPELLNIHIFVDFRPAWGDVTLARKLREHLTERAAGAHRFLHVMAAAGASMTAPLGVIGQFKTQEGRLNLKTSGLLPLTASVRILALKHRIPFTGTADRLSALAENSHMALEEARTFRDSHELMVRILVEQQLADLADGIPLSSRIDPKRLRPHEARRLKEGFKHINSLIWVMNNALSTV